MTARSVATTRRSSPSETSCHDSARSSGATAVTLRLRLDRARAVAERMLEQRQRLAVLGARQQLAVEILRIHPRQSLDIDRFRLHFLAERDS